MITTKNTNPQKPYKVRYSKVNYYIDTLEDAVLFAVDRVRSSTKPLVIQQLQPYNLVIGGQYYKGVFELKGLLNN